MAALSQGVKNGRENGLDCSGSIGLGGGSGGWVRGLAGIGWLNSGCWMR